MRSRREKLKRIKKKKKLIEIRPAFCNLNELIRSIVTTVYELKYS